LTRSPVALADRNINDVGKPGGINGTSSSGGKGGGLGGEAMRFLELGDEFLRILFLLLLEGAMFILTYLTKV
jgi:hypothetical protein